jgi:HSP20 family protein
MLDSLKEVGRNVGREINRAWESVAEGWHELLNRSGNALTHFSRRSAAEGEDGSAAGGLPASSPRWGLLAGEVEETDKELVVRVEVPGLEKEDCRISIEDNVLYLSGEKRFERESGDSTYHVTERAYGMFQRSIPLPCRVDPDQADARYRNGVLTVRLRKMSSGRPRCIPVS